MLTRAKRTGEANEFGMTSEGRVWKDCSFVMYRCNDFGFDLKKIHFKFYARTKTRDYAEQFREHFKELEVNGVFYPLKKEREVTLEVVFVG